MITHAEFEKKRENKQELGCFPFEYYYVDQRHPRYTMPFHWHMESEFIQVLQGTFHLSIDGTTYELTPGKFAFIPSGTIHGGFPVASDCIYECIVIDLEFFLKSMPLEQGTFTNLLNHGSNIQRIFSVNGYALDVLNLLFTEARNDGPGHELMIAGDILFFVGTVVREKLYSIPSEKQSHSAQQAQLIKRSLSKIRHDYRLPLTLEDLSSEATMAPNYFCRIFRTVTGRPPIDYLNYYRVERAAELIYATNENLTTIAMQCGFNDLGYFSRSFKKYKGMSPREYRKKTRILSKQGNH